MTRPPSPWTDQLVQKLELLWKKCSASAIVEIFKREDGIAFTRNAVTGKLDRMGFRGGDRNARLLVVDRTGPGENKPPRPRLLAQRPARAKPTPIARALPPVIEVECHPRHLSLLQLEENDCRYECSGADDIARYTFCGHPNKDGASYCAHHAAICFEKPRPRPNRPIWQKMAA